MKVGDLVYLDSFCGLVPCKVMALYAETADINITATRRAYIRGDEITTVRFKLVERQRVHVQNGKYVIR